MTTAHTTELLRIDDLEVAFEERGVLTNRPVRGITLAVAPGEVVGIVGETGCGKSLTGLAVLGLLPKGAVPRGRVLLDGVEQPFDGSGSARGEAISIVFQNPGTAFNPVFTLGRQMRDVVDRHRRVDGHRLGRAAAKAHILHYLAQVGLPDPERVFRSYPHELSGGMLQRAMIAMALVCEPKLLILDEPTTALDVTIAKQILELILELRDGFGFGVLLITHNLGVVREVCDRIAVLYAGRVVETGPTDAVLRAPAHPYTRGLLGALPARHRPGQALDAIRGAVPGNLLGLTGCSFRERCPIAVDACADIDPGLGPVSPFHEAACIVAAAPEGVSS
ncbi:peptide/nickel transport system ATP-binding protein [Microbacterium keratanolyticum]|uniref:ABC transporter ATP-binding protein n=1 Tax=Microbacterium keratanolyticum TaxID=67574 RepID=A0A9W6HR15_9MICO|nr:ABC transporter ATP-binding protein [Microbacterium keratanolyticum]MBM7468736.1 peptide/nickel transport system ATP-binding protein [Microbacterium keratanolyticum]GLK00812.1 ABC transporter ATP-binding protein [Microbacterium keratanolyticum]